MTREIIVPSLKWNPTTLAFELEADTDLQVILGRLALTTQRTSDWVTLSHFDKKVGATSYAIGLDPYGGLFLNAVTGRAISFGINDTSKVYLDVNMMRLSLKLDMNGNYIDNINYLLGNGTFLRIGSSGTSGHSLTTDKDLLIAGKIEVDGAFYFDASGTFYSSVKHLSDLQMYDNTWFALGTGWDTILRWSTAQTSHTVVWALGDGSKSIIFTTKANRDKNHGHGNQTDPTEIIHSATDPTSNDTEWVSKAHNKTDAVYQTGKGTHRFKEKITADLGIDVKGPLTFIGATAGIPLGAMHQHDLGTVVTISATNIPTEIGAGFSAGPSFDVPFQNVKEFKIAKAGLYKASWSVSFSTAGGSNQNIEGGVMVNGSAILRGTAHRFIGTASDIGDIEGNLSLDLAVDDLVSLYVMNETDTQNIVVDHADCVIDMKAGT